MSNRTRAALELLHALTLDVGAIDAPFVTSLRDRDLDTASMRQVTAIGFRFNFMNRLADAFDFAVLDGVAQRRMTGLLNFAARVVRRSPEASTWVRGQDGQIRPPALHRARERLLAGEALTDKERRQNVDAYVRSQWVEDEAPAVELPVALETYLNNLARHAYRIVDDEVDALRKDGLNDEAIFEVTVVGTVASASVGVEALYRVLFG